MESARTGERLTERELEVLALVGRGRTNGQIAEELGITFATAKWYVSQLISKEGVSSREELAARWQEQHGLRARMRGWVRAAFSLSAMKVALGGAATAVVIAAGGAVVLGTRGSGAEPGDEATSTLEPAPPPPAVSSRNIPRVSPADGGTVTRASTVPKAIDQPGGVCAEVTFDGLTQNFRAFRMALDGTDVTPQLAIFAGGQMCLAEPGGVPPGRHTARVEVVDSADATGKPTQTVSWSFDVTP